MGVFWYMMKGLFFFFFFTMGGCSRSLWTPGYVADSSWEPACSKFGCGVSLKLENAAT